jgi:hypothetical protein
MLRFPSDTEAITQEPSNAALYQNRALCFQKLAKWDGVVQDAGDLFVSMH